jgi:hypothetical protein
MAGRRALVVAAPQPPPARLLARRAAHAVAAAAAARVAAAGAHVGAAQVAQQLGAAEDVLLGAPAAAGLDHHVAAHLGERQRREGGRVRGGLPACCASGAVRPARAPLMPGAGRPAHGPPGARRTLPHGPSWQRSTHEWRPQASGLPQVLPQDGAFSSHLSSPYTALPQGQLRRPSEGHAPQAPPWHTRSHVWRPQARALPQTRAHWKPRSWHGSVRSSAPQQHASRPTWEGERGAAKSHREDEAKGTTQGHSDMA